MPDPGTLGPVVCNTGPLIALCKINHVHLLPHLSAGSWFPQEMRQNGYFLSDRLVYGICLEAGE